MNRGEKKKKKERLEDLKWQYEEDETEPGDGQGHHKLEDANTQTIGRSHLKEHESRVMVPYQKTLFFSSIGAQSKSLMPMRKVVICVHLELVLKHFEVDPEAPDTLLLLATHAD
ncbi:hypothetical protein SAY87_007024 [Trapa incisa]|uniref:Uncharacterized protein n=1 Tax=Trapa incisa TaxID=236973 RepID=A0AAN7K0K1_9MYRT|nr:hypothetical protein SAY87_007024 [Trapa incisa]